MPLCLNGIDYFIDLLEFPLRLLFDHLVEENLLLHLFVSDRYLAAVVRSVETTLSEETLHRLVAHLPL